MMKQQVLLFIVLAILATALIAAPNNVLKVKTVSTEFSNAIKRSPNQIVQALVQVTSDAHSDNGSAKRSIEDDAMHALGSYLGQDVYIVKTQVKNLEKLRQNKHVRWLGQYKPEHKFEIFKDNSDESAKRAFLDGKEASFEREFSKLIEESEQARELNVPVKKSSKSAPRTLETNFARMINGEKIFLVTAQVEKSESTLGSKREAKETKARRLVQEISGKLAANLVNSVAVSAEKLAFAVRASSMEQVYEAMHTIGQSEDIHWVEPVPVHEMHNKWSKFVTQNMASKNANAQSPFKTMGITGSGQIVGVGDSGLDYNSCFFYDPNNAAPISNFSTPVTSSKHRKIHGVWSLIDSIAEDGAHGTHVAGTVLGNEYGQRAELTPFNGMAEDAKVSFTDIGCTNPAGCVCHDAPCECDLIGKCPSSPSYVFLPLDLNTHYFPYFYNSGARIQTNSWGGAGGFGGYSMATAEIDTFVYNHKDLTVLFSAGNSGQDWNYVSIGTHAQAKNILAVGASMNTLDMFKYNVENVYDYDAIAKRYGSLVLSIYCSDLEPPCGNLTERQRESYKTLLRVCDFFKNSFNTEADCCSQAAFPCNSSSLACGCSFSSLGNYCCKKCVTQRFTTSSAKIAYNEGNLAYFSARGPTTDGRIKPDILAPGHSLLSARSWDSLAHPKVCPLGNDIKYSDHLLSMGGTSMSCPNAAGNAALVRQFFTDGYYTGRKNEAAGFNPPASLVKAVMINSGEALTGFVDFYGMLIKLHPTLAESQTQEIVFNNLFFEGFGLINLQSLPQSGEQKTLLFANNNKANDQPQVKNHEKQYYCLRIGKTIPTPSKAKFTLVWTDPPASPASATALVNNLDLIVKDANGDILNGNIGGKNQNARDHLNNVEQVVIDKAAGGDYVVIVEGSSVPQGPQDFSLVITAQAGLEWRECTDKEKEIDPSKPVPPVNPPVNPNIEVPGALVFAGLIGVLLLLVLTVAVVALVILAYLQYKRGGNAQLKAASHSDAVPLRDADGNQHE